MKMRTPLLLFLILLPVLTAQAGITVTHPEIRETDHHYLIHAQFSYQLEDGVVDAVKNGIPLVFVTEYALEEEVPFWETARTIQENSHRFVLSYRAFNNRYYLVSLNNKSHGTYDTLEQALSRMEMRHDALSVEKSLLKEGKPYQAKIRSSLDSSALPGLIRPYVYTPWLWPEWKLDSGWHTIQIGAQE